MVSMDGLLGKEAKTLLKKLSALFDLTDDMHPALVPIHRMREGRGGRCRVL
jgi:hypothetical protein